MKKIWKLGLLMLILILILILVCYIWIGAIKKNAEKIAIEFNNYLISELGYSDNYYSDKIKYNVLNNSCDVLLTNSDCSIQLWYRVDNEDKTANCVNFNKPNESKHITQLPQSFKKRQIQYSILKFVKAKMYTNYIIITDETELNGIYIAKMILPDKQKEITAEVDIKNKYRGYDKIVISTE